MTTSMAASGAIGPLGILRQDRDRFVALAFSSADIGDFEAPRPSNFSQPRRRFRGRSR